MEDSPAYRRLCGCDPEGCSTAASQCVDVAFPVEVSPSAIVGEITASCQGMPTVTCRTDGNRNVCILTVTQQICLTIPVEYNVTTCAGAAVIACSDEDDRDSGCPCIM